MSLTHRELTRALEINRQLEYLSEQAERFQSIGQVNLIAVQEMAKRMETALSLTTSRLYPDALQETLKHFDMPKISLNMDSLVPSNINFTKIHNKLINDFQKISNNLIIPDPFTNMPILLIDTSPINLPEPTTDIDNSNKNTNIVENVSDHIDQEFEFDKSSLLEHNLLHFEITRLRRELHQDRRNNLMIVLSTLVSYSVLQGFLEGSDSVWLPIISILGRCLLDQWSSEKD